MERDFACFFTGHRRLPAEKIKPIKAILRKKIKSLIEDKGVTDFISGAAAGFDTLAASVVIGMKKNYPYIRLHLYVPCVDQDRLWNDDDKRKWREIRKKADDVVFITDGEYTDSCMRQRNIRMTCDALYGISFCLMRKSGTGMTLNYARHRGCITENIADSIYEKK